MFGTLQEHRTDFFIGGDRMFILEKVQVRGGFKFKLNRVAYCFVCLPLKCTPHLAIPAYPHRILGLFFFKSSGNQKDRNHPVRLFGLLLRNLN